jgi:hypothetical protein
MCKVGRADICSGRLRRWEPPVTSKYRAYGYKLSGQIESYGVEREARWEHRKGRHGESMAEA